MKINADFSQRVLVHSEALAWQASPMPGVDRRPLDRVGDEVARATTIVRYAPGSHFSPHVHKGGEEFLVLDGVFQDEHGDYPAGSYIRNPPQSSHTPGAKKGCVIFVKLWQFEPNDNVHVRIRSDNTFAVPHKDWPGIAVMPLFVNQVEQVMLLEMDNQAKLHLSLPGGAELLILDGELTEASDRMKKHSWLRLPKGYQLSATAIQANTRVWLKTGHLVAIDNQLKRITDSAQERVSEEPLETQF